MKKYLHLVLFLLVFAGFAQAQGPASTANWFGFELPPNPAANKYITFTLQDLGSVSIASDEHPQAVAATFADGYVWSVNNINNGYSICRSRFDAANNLIEEPETMAAGLSYVTDMEYNPADGLIYFIMGEHLKSFDPANPNNIQDRGAIEHDGFNLAIDLEGNAYMISSWGEYGVLNLSNAQLTIISPIDLPLRMAFDMMTGELFGIHYGNLYQIDPNTGTYTMLGALHDGSDNYDPSFMFMTYGMNPSEFAVGDLIYRVNDDQVSVTVIGHVDGPDATGELTIPESVSYGGHNYAVTIIGEDAFFDCYELTGDLVIPNSVITIEGGAFMACDGFSGTLTIGTSVNYIGDYAFGLCNSFTGGLTIPDLVTSIGDYAFYACRSFTGDLIIPNSVNYIGESAFMSCRGFDGTLTIGNAVAYIGASAFVQCNGLKGILNIPSSAEFIYGNAFELCQFDGIIVDPENNKYDSRNNCNAIIETITNVLLTGCKNTVIPNTVTAIGDGAFKDISDLTSISIPNSVTSIGNNAFAFCSDLAGDLTIPNSVISIGNSAFFGCDSFAGTLTIGESVSYIGEWAFRHCAGFTAAVSLATTPPYLGGEDGGEVFSDFGTTVLTVPCECSEAYQNSSWYDPSGLNGFTEFIEDCTAVSETGSIVTAVYPNPTDGMIKIEAENMKSISIFNLLGEKVFEGSVNGETFEYDFSHQGTGVYLIKVETTMGIETTRITVR